MTGYKLLTYDSNGTPRAGLLVGDMVHDLADSLNAAGKGAGIDAISVLGALQTWDATRDAIEAIVPGLADSDGGSPLTDTSLLAPILYPPAMFCAGANYWDHMREMAEIARKTTGTAPEIVKPEDPWFFVKTAHHSVIGPGAEIRLPKFSKMVDWESEIGIVIGKLAKDVPLDKALDYVAGYTIVNDLSARDYIKREGSQFIFDWIGQKCFDGSAPMGPWIAPAADFADVDDIAVQLWVNDEIEQDSNTNQLIHNFAEQIEYLSRHLTLRPGDVIATGSPAGVGMPKGKFLKPGDKVRIRVAGVGELVNPVVAD